MFAGRQFLTGHATAITTMSIMNVIFIYRGVWPRFRVNRPWWPFVALALWATGCVDPPSHRDVADAAARRILFKNLAERVIAPTYADFARSTTRLAKAADAYATSLADDDLKDARAAFVDAMLIWERAEVFQVGPSAPVSASSPGGQGFRQQFYAWPKVNRCGISRGLVEQAYKDEASFALLFPDARGLGALEILLFDTGVASGCAKTNSILVSGAWDNLSADELLARRGLYARSVAADLAARAPALGQAWRKFTRELATAGAGSSLFGVTQDALNALSDALFYLDTETKDMKLATPLGLTESCTGEGCLGTFEHPLAKISGQSIRANIEAFRDLFRGLPPAPPGAAMAGLRDLLRSVSADKLARDMDALLDASLADIGAVGSLEEAVASADPRAMKVYTDLQSLTDRLKTDFIAVLALKRPMTAAGDND